MMVAALQLYYTASEERLQLQRPKVPSHFGNMAFLYNYKSVWHNLYAAQNKLLSSVYFSGRKNIALAKREKIKKNFCTFYKKEKLYPPI